MNHPIHIEEFIKLSRQFPVIDVRSPGEFKIGHIPGAHNVPLFNDEERAKVGTAYKKTGKQKAIEIGLDVVGPKLLPIVQAARTIAGGSNTLLVHCWRGGMRSANVANLLNVYGYKTHTLIKGYKAYREEVRSQFEKDLKLIVIGGETGSGKSDTLHKISAMGEQIIDLERLAHHKGSAFGALGEEPQPHQEHFENRLAESIRQLDLSRRIWIEDESHAIGRCFIPNSIWDKMKSAPILRMNVPKTDRIERLMEDYGRFPKAELARCIQNIEKRLGPQHAKHALQELELGNLRTVADITLTYYDKAYLFNHEEKRGMKGIFTIPCKNADPEQNASLLLAYANQNF